MGAEEKVRSQGERGYDNLRQNLCIGTGANFLLGDAIFTELKFALGKM